jgi:hypothetical protein
MNFKRLMLGFATLTALGTPALAAPPEVSAGQLQAKQALSVFDLGLANDRVTVTREGRRDLVMVSHQDRAEVIANLKSAYTTSRTLPNGYSVEGWAHLAANNSHTFTLKNSAGERLVAEVMDDAQGTKVKIWGGSRLANPQKQPLGDAPRRFGKVL